MISTVFNALLVLFMVRIIKQPPWIVGMNVDIGENVEYEKTSIMTCSFSGCYRPKIGMTVLKPFKSILKNK